MEESHNIPKEGVFEILQPLCVSVAKSQNAENLVKLREALESIDCESLQVLNEYIMFPMRVILKQPNQSQENMYIEVFKCLSSLLSKCQISRFESFLDLFNSLCCLFSSPSSCEVIKWSEEMKIAGIDCLVSILKNTSESILLMFYKNEFLPVLGHAITLLLKIAESERNRDLKVSAMCCISQLISLNNSPGLLSLKSIGDIFASFLPGLSLGLCKVITGDMKQGYKVISTAIETWTKILTLIMGDKYVIGDNCDSIDSSSNTEKYAHLLVYRNSDWVNSTQEKLTILIRNVTNLSNNSNWRVRMALCKWANTLICNCRKSLDSSITDLISVLVISASDDVNAISSFSEKCLINLRHYLTGSDKTLLLLCEENIYDLTSKLPRIMRTNDDEEKILSLKLIAGYISILGPEVNRLFYSRVHLDRLTEALMNVAHFDCSFNKYIAERTADLTIYSLKSSNSEDKFTRGFKYMENDDIMSSLSRVCQILASYCDMDVLCESLLEHIKPGSVHKKQSLLCLNEVLRGFSAYKDEDSSSSNSHSSLDQIIAEILDEIMQQENFYLKTSMAEDKYFMSDAISLKLDGLHCPHSIEEMNSNIFQTCLVLECIGGCAMILGVNFQDFLIDVLYAVLQKLGSDVAIINETANKTLNEIVSACEYDDVRDVIAKNVDYLVDSLSRHLYMNQVEADAPSVLNVILRHSDVNVLPLIKENIYQILSYLDNRYGDDAYHSLKALNFLVFSLARWFCDNFKTIDDYIDFSGKAFSVPNESQQSVVEFFREYLENRKTAFDELSEDVSNCEIKDDDHLDHEMEPDEEKSVPFHVTLVVEVLNRCSHLLSSPDMRIRLLVMQIICHSSIALINYRDHLLPEIHKVWKSFIPRLRDKELIVCIQAYLTLLVMSKCCTDFLMQRMNKEVLPVIIEELQLSSQISMKSGPGFKMTMKFKLQRMILKSIGVVCELCEIREAHLHRVIKACTPYLSCRQPSELQEVTFRSFEHFCHIEPDAVWYFLLEIHNPFTFTPPFPIFKPVIVNGSTENNEFSDNCLRIFSILNNCHV